MSDTQDQTDDMRPCPRCAELIKSKASYCRHCKVDIDVKTWKAKPKKSGAFWKIAVAVLIVALVATAVIGAISTLGSSANSTFESVSDSMR